MNLICEVAEDVEIDQALEECNPRPHEMSAQLDGNDLKIVKATSEGVFDFRAGPASMIASANSRFRAVAGGTWVGPMALPVGQHILRFEARSDDLELDVTYNLTVE